MSLSQAALDYLNGIRMTPEQIQERKIICGNCPYLGDRLGFKKQFPFIGNTRICTACNCYLDGELGKIEAPREECPKKYWKAV